jgi:thiamine kinase-like enzyme
VYATEEQRSVVRFLWAKALNAKGVRNEMFPVDGGKCLPRKAVHKYVETFSQRRSKVADDETKVRKWLRQQTKDLYAVGFDALV